MSAVASLSPNDVAHLIIDYMIVCENRRELLEFSDFIPLWIEANAIAVDAVTMKRERADQP